MAMMKMAASHQEHIFLSPVEAVLVSDVYTLSSTVYVDTLASLAHDTSYIPGRRWGRTPHSVSLIELVQLSKNGIYIPRNVIIGDIY